MTRGADRKPDYMGKMIKVVPDLPAAEFLRELFRSPIKRVGTIPLEEQGFKHSGKAGRPKGHPNRGGRPRSNITAEQRSERRKQYERERYAARTEKPSSETSETRRALHK